MITRLSLDNHFPMVILTATVGWLLIGVTLADELPDSIRSQWKVKTDQIELRWNSEKRILNFHQLTAKAVVYGPSNLYEQDYAISFRSDVTDATVLLILGEDGNPTRISGKILEQNESGNPKVLLINKAGMIVGETSPKPNRVETGIEPAPPHHPACGFDGASLALRAVRWTVCLAALGCTGRFPSVMAPENDPSQDHPDTEPSGAR